MKRMIWLFCLALLGPGSARAEVARWPAKVSKVLVFSNQARVFREAWVPLRGGTVTAALADLPASMVPDSLRVECKTADVERVSLEQRRGKLPRQEEAEAMVKKLEAQMDRLARVAAEDRMLRKELSLIDRLGLDTSTPTPTPGGRNAPSEGMFADAWSTILTWSSSRSGAIRAELLRLADRRRELQNGLDKLLVEASEYRLSSVGQPVMQVQARLKGKAGKHRVTVVYDVVQVRWVPSYDLRYLPNKQAVEAVYYAVTRQQSGEDWSDARLRYSTSMPTRLLAIPELPTWTLGRRRDFHPTPVKRPETRPDTWRPSASVEPVPPVVQKLSRLVDRASRGEGSSLGAGWSSNEGRKDVLKDRFAKESRNAYRPRPAKPRDSSRLERERRPAELDMDDGVEEEAAAEVMADASPMPSVAPSAPAGVQLSAKRMSSVRTGGSAAPPTEQVPWSDAGYRPPYIPSDLPAAAAQGYRFTLYAPGKHTVPANNKDHRIPLLRRTVSVKPVYRITPGVSPYAYLVARMKNDTGKPILRGRAYLFSGTMYSGTSWINTALPGREIELPLGVDDSVKVERQQDQKTAVKGVVFKDDATVYTVQIQVANNHPYPIRVELLDQVPRAEGDKIKVGGFSSDAGMTGPDSRGRVRWEGTVKANSVKTLSFTFRIVRPRDWEVRQYNG